MSEKLTSWSTLPPGNDNPSPAEQLAHDLSISQLAIWLAIEDGKTSEQAEGYWQQSIELDEYLYVLGYRLVGKDADRLSREDERRRMAEWLDTANFAQPYITIQNLQKMLREGRAPWH